MIFALLPVKPPQEAKQRLRAVLSAEQRETLARAMYEEVFAALRAARGLDRIVVMTADAATAEHARRHGALVFDEPGLLGHRNSADRAARRAIGLGARTVLMLPIDVPLVTSAEIEELIAAARPGVIVVPSFDGAGTNALVLTPPDAIESCFGENSFASHMEQARVKGVPVQVLRPPGILLDIDTPEDIAELLARAPQSRIAALLRGEGSFQPSANSRQQQAAKL